MDSIEFKDMRTGEIVTQFNIMDIAHFEKVVTTNGQTQSEVDAIREEVREGIETGASFNDIEEMMGDGDPMDYL